MVGTQHDAKSGDLDPRKHRSGHMSGIHVSGVRSDAAHGTNRRNGIGRVSGIAALPRAGLRDCRDRIAPRLRDAGELCQPRSLHRSSALLCGHAQSGVTGNAKTLLATGARREKQQRFLPGSKSQLAPLVSPSLRRERVSTLLVRSSLSGCSTAFCAFVQTRVEEN